MKKYKKNLLHQRSFLSAKKKKVRKHAELELHKICSGCHFSGAGNEELAKCQSWSITSNGPLNCCLAGRGAEQRAVLQHCGVLVLWVWHWYLSHLGSDPQLAGGGSRMSSKDSGSSLSVTSLAFAGPV